MSEDILKRLRTETLYTSGGEQADLPETAAERYALRSELAAANDMKRRMTDACEEANRVAEQYRAELAAATARLENALNEGAKRRAERDALRELLREAYPHIWPGERALADNLRARIYAALNKGGMDE